jgi:acyl-homoserine-lactone acylase
MSRSAVHFSALLIASTLATLSCGYTQESTQRYEARKGTEILWDKWGVPHIFAKSIPDMFFCYGWAQAEAHGDLLLRMFGRSRGRAAEYFGAGVADSNLKSDRWVLTNEVPKRSSLWLAQQSGTFRHDLDAFAAGIDAYAAKHPEALDEESKRVLPVTALDLIEREQHFVNFEFVANQRLAAPVRTTSAAAGATPETGPAELLRNTTGPIAAKDAQSSYFDATDLGAEDGSNGWAIAPSHSASGKAMLLMNPHLAWAGEQSYFEIQLTAPGVSLYGATQIGLPSLRFVFSDQLAITNTVNTNNGALLYSITEKDGGYLFDGKVLPFARVTYPIKIRLEDGSFKVENLEVLRTVHGPIIRRDDGIPIALHVAGLDKPFALEQIWKMGIARNFAEYQAQLRRLQIPMYNILYADRDGHIEYLFNADVPRRSEGDFQMWQHPVAGDTSKLLPTGSLTYDELPKIIDPPSGYVQNSNEPPWDAAWPVMIDPKQYPPYISASFPSFRSDRALRMLSEESKIGYDMLLEKKLSTRSEFADRILPGLLAAAEEYGTSRAKAAAAVLRDWDRQTESGSRGALLFYTWSQHFLGTSTATTTPQSQRNFAVPYSIAEPLTTPRGLKDPQAAAAMLDMAAEETEKLYGALDTPWGKVMRLEINGQSDGSLTASRGPALNGVDLPGNGGYGGIGIFRVVTWGPLLDGIKTPIHGDGFTIALEFTNPIHAKSLVSYGESSQPGSMHHTDQLPLFEHKQWRDVWRTRPDVEANLERRESF